MTKDAQPEWRTKRDPSTPMATFEWLERFVDAMEQRGASARFSGDAAATASAHVDESGQPIAELFGSPEDYAREMIPRRRAPLRRFLGVGALMSLYLTSFMLVLTASPGNQQTPVPRLWWLQVLLVLVMCWLNAAAYVLLRGWRLYVACLIPLAPVLVAIFTLRGDALQAPTMGLLVGSVVLWALQAPVVWLLRTEVVRHPVTGVAYDTRLNKWIKDSWWYLLMVPLFLVLKLVVY